MFQPSRRGRITLCPRLETGKSSDAPWRRPSTIACPYEIRLASGSKLRAHAGASGAARLEPGEDETGESDEERRDPVLDVVVGGPGLVSRHPRRERARRF